MDNRVVDEIDESDFVENPWPYIVSREVEMLPFITHFFSNTLFFFLSPGFTWLEVLPSIHHFFSNNLFFFLHHISSGSNFYPGCSTPIYLPTPFTLSLLSFRNETGIITFSSPSPVLPIEKSRNQFNRCRPQTTRMAHRNLGRHGQWKSILWDMDKSFW